MVERKRNSRFLSSNGSLGFPYHSKVEVAGFDSRLRALFMKICSQCKIPKNKNQFSKRKDRPSGRKSMCKSCEGLQKKEYRSRPETKERERFRSKTEKVKQYRKKYRKTKSYVLSRRRTWKKQIEKRRSNIQFRLTCNLRSRISNALHRKLIGKKVSAVKDLGCTIKEFIKFLETKFVAGMSWRNYGEWEIDHIKPLASFDLTNQRQQKAAVHYTNLQPLWQKDNNLKRAKFIGESRSKIKEDV